MFEALGHYMDLLMDAICVVNNDHEFIYISAGGERVFGYPPEEMVGRSMFEFIHPDDIAKTKDVVSEIIAGTAQTHFENRYLRKNGDIAHIVWSARYSPDDELRIAVARDVTAQRATEREKEQLLKQLDYSAHHDSLTELPNRSYFYRKAELVLQNDSPIALAYLDLNNFKEINDDHGHAVGDSILRASALRLKNHIRTQDIIARIGGDEFVAIFTEVNDKQAGESILHKLQQAIAQPIRLNGMSFTISASIGCVISRPPHPNLETLLGHADTLMYDAKQNCDDSALVTLL